MVVKPRISFELLRYSLRKDFMSDVKPQMYSNLFPEIEQDRLLLVLISLLKDSFPDFLQGQV